MAKIKEWITANSDRVAYPKLRTPDGRVWERHTEYKTRAEAEVEAEKLKDGFYPDTKILDLQDDTMHRIYVYVTNEKMAHGGEVDEKLETIYKKYSDKDYWGYADAYRGRPEITEEVKKQKERAGFDWLVNKTKQIIADKNISELKNRIRYDQKVTIEIYEALTDESLKGMNNKQLSEYFDKTYGSKMADGGELTVANEIRRQVGHKALYMLGAKDLAGDEHSFSFKIRGSKKWKHIKIFLNGKDLYDVTFTTWHGDKLTKKTVNDVYVDNLHSVIREETGLYTNLAKGGSIKTSGISWIITGTFI